MIQKEWDNGKARGREWIVSSLLLQLSTVGCLTICQATPLKPTARLQNAAHYRKREQKPTHCSKAHLFNLSYTQGLAAQAVTAVIMLNNVFLC